jgi:hypothetical protein
MFERFNSNFQNVVSNPNTNFDPNQDQYFGRNDKTPYVEGMNSSTPAPMLGGATESSLYPLESSLATPFLNTAPTNSNSINVGYAQGGKVKKGNKSNGHNNPYSVLAELIRQQGKGEDSILAHINPLEAMILKNLGGSGTINPKTGLPQFGLFSNPKKWFKSVVGPAAGVVLGNMILPGVGGMIGGALGGAAGSKIRGRKDVGQSALRGFGMGAALPTAAGLIGTGANAMGATNVGHALTKYGNINAILPSLGLGNMSGSERLLAPGENNMGSYMGGSSAPQNALASSITTPQREMGFTDKLLGNTKDYLTKPTNLLTLGSLAGSFMNRPKEKKEKKEKTPEQQADEAKRLAKGLMLNPGERADQEANLLAEEQMRRRIARNKFLPEERFTIEPLHVRTNTPEEYQKQRKWLNYYNNPQFTGESIPYKEGGSTLPRMMFEAEEMEYPSGLGRYIAGETKGQDDKIKALLSDGEFVIPTDIVSDLGDGNNVAGAKELDKLILNVRKHKRGGKINLPPKAKSLANYMRG